MKEKEDEYMDIDQFFDEFIEQMKKDYAEHDKNKQKSEKGPGPDNKVFAEVGSVQDSTE